MKKQFMCLAMILSLSFPAAATEFDDLSILSVSEREEMLGTPSEFQDREILKGIEQAVGFYSKGSLLKSDRLPLQSQGLLKIMQARDRGYATGDLVEILLEAASEIQVNYPKGERLQIGDVSDSNGGQLARHASHQNGLDADIVYFRKNNKEQDPNSVGGFQESFVNQGKVTPNFDSDRNGDFIFRLVESQRVGRIFVDQAIKTHFCQKWKKQLGDPAYVNVLRKLRPLTNHHDHMHLRLTCPPTSPRCVEQSPPPAGSGC
jgi:penicillin-insensitive murein DD-endopeptidase